jgi:hypothetical protein
MPLDHSRSALDSLALGDGELVHAGWVHSHSARSGDSCGFDPLDPRSKSGSLM